MALGLLGEGAAGERDALKLKQLAVGRVDGRNPRYPSPKAHARDSENTRGFREPMLSDEPLQGHYDIVTCVTDFRKGLDRISNICYTEDMNETKTGSKKCCDAARSEMANAQSIMSAFSPLMPIYADAESRRDLAQLHLNNCAEPRRRAMADRIVANLNNGGR